MNADGFEVSSKVDWIAGTIKMGMEASISLLEPFGIDGGRQWEATRPLSRYKRAMVHRSGCMVMDNPDRAELGTHVIMTGRVVDEIEAGWLRSGDTLIGAAHKSNLRLSRVDLAVDVFNGRLDPKVLWDNWGHPDRTGTVRTADWRERSAGRGKTLYIGSETSDARVRVYDKGAEQGVDLDWTRIEAQLEDEKARWASSENVAAGYDELKRFTCGLARTMSDWPHIPEWVRVVEGCDKVKHKIERRPTKTMEWVDKQVIPALRRHIREYGLDWLPDYIAAKLKE